MSQTQAERDRESPPSTPRWVKGFVGIILVLVLLFVGLHLTGNNPGGPGSHTSPIQHGVQPP